MHFRFLHVSDVHLGFRQYNESFRAHDFAHAFKEVIARAIAEQVQFVLIAGDLFHKRAIDAQTLDQAYRRLEQLRQAGIPCVVIEGNHEMAYYGEEGSWLGFLRARGLITLLQTDFDKGVASFAPVRSGSGGWVDPIPGVRIYGLGYKGAGAPTAVELCALALDGLPPEERTGVEFTIFAAHTGVLGELPGDALSPTLPQWLSLRPHVDYVALGHIHKPFIKDDWLFNPGSLETCASNEWAWGDRAALLVDVDTACRPAPSVRV
jgi:DNA repair exonuclease SbcCD nuclease subunit